MSLYMSVEIGLAKGRGHIVPKVGVTSYTLIFIDLGALEPLNVSSTGSTSLLTFMWVSGGKSCHTNARQDRGVAQDAL